MQPLSRCPRLPGGKEKWFQDAGSNLTNPTDPAWSCYWGPPIPTTCSKLKLLPRIDCTRFRFDFTFPPMTRSLSIICQDFHARFSRIQSRLVRWLLSSFPLLRVLNIGIESHDIKKTLHCSHPTRLDCIQTYVYYVIVFHYISRLSCLSSSQ